MHNFGGALTTPLNVTVTNTPPKSTQNNNSNRYTCDSQASTSVFALLYSRCSAMIAPARQRHHTLPIVTAKYFPLLRLTHALLISEPSTIDRYSHLAHANPASFSIICSFSRSSIKHQMQPLYILSYDTVHIL